MTLAVSAAAGSVASQAVPGVLGFLIVAGMGVALFFLLRSLNKQLRKVQPKPPVRAGAARAAKAGGQPGGGQAAGSGSKP